jgi:hypothetical protein
MPSQSKRRPPPGPPAPRRPSESRANLDPGAYIGRKPERPVGQGNRDATATSTADEEAARRPNQNDGG